MSELYYVIWSSCDGNVRVQSYSKGYLLEMLNGKLRDEGKLPPFVDSVNSPQNPGYWGDKMCIIKGECLTPKTEEIVTRVGIS